MDRTMYDKWHRLHMEHAAEKARRAKIIAQLASPPTVLYDDRNHPLFIQANANSKSQPPQNEPVSPPQPRAKPSFLQKIVDCWARALKTWNLDDVTYRLHCATRPSTRSHSTNDNVHQQKATEDIAKFNTLVDSTFNNVLALTFRTSGIDANHITAHLENLIRTHWYIWSNTGSADWIEPIFTEEGAISLDDDHHFHEGVADLMAHRCDFIYDRTGSKPLARWLETTGWQQLHKYFSTNATIVTLLTLDEDSFLDEDYNGPDKKHANNLFQLSSKKMLKMFMHDRRALIDARYVASKPGFNLGALPYIQSLPFAARVYAFFMSPIIPAELTMSMGIGDDTSPFGNGEVNQAFDDYHLVPAIRVFLAFRLFSDAVRLRFMPVIMAIAIRNQFALQWESQQHNHSSPQLPTNVSPTFGLYFHSLLFASYPYLDAYIKLQIRVAHMGEELHATTLEPVYEAARGLMRSGPLSEISLRHNGILTAIHAICKAKANDDMCETRMSSCNHGHCLCDHDFDRRTLDICRMYYIRTTQRGQSDLMPPRLDHVEAPRYTWASLIQVVSSPSAMDVRWAQFVNAPMANLMNVQVPQLRRAAPQINAHFNRWLTRGDLWPAINAWPILLNPTTLTRIQEREVEEEEDDDDRMTQPPPLKRFKLAEEEE